jgi:hypothetical protein
MNIIFGKENIPAVDEKYTVLELDTVRMLPVDHCVTVYCLVENMPISNIPRIAEMKSLHENLMSNYRKRDWNYCTQALDHLQGFWGAEIDTFYDSLRQRISHYSNNDPGDLWDGFIEKQVAEQQN